VQCAPSCHRSGRLFLFANIATSLVPTPASCLHLPHPAEGLYASRMRSTALGLLGWVLVHVTKFFHALF
jgi:hypothetical protein